MSATAPAWLAVYRHELVTAASLHEIPLPRFCALVEQESNGGLNPRTLEHDPRQLYRYEAGYWRKYLATNKAYAPPEGAESGPAFELWKRRVSASYGLCQVMYGTARDLGFPPEWPPEELLKPMSGLAYGAKYLRRCLRGGVPWRVAWLNYNGGGRPAYADEVEARVPRFEALLAGGRRT